MDGKHKKVIKATAKEIVKIFLKNMNDQRKNVKKEQKKQAIFSEFPIEGLPNVIIEDQTSAFNLPDSSIRTTIQILNLHYHFGLISKRYSHLKILFL